MPDELSIYAFKLLTRVAARISRIPKQIYEPKSTEKRRKLKPLGIKCLLSLARRLREQLTLSV